jgi:formylglycine-generating enzyme required for sulfatase activity
MSMIHNWHVKYSHLYAAVFLAVLFVLPVQAFCGIAETLVAGDQALKKKEYAAAEQILSQALQSEADNYRVLKSLAEAKMGLKKYKEANDLIDKLLAMPVTNGKKVLVTLEGETEPLEAEIVDETVILKEAGKNNMRNYLSPASPEPVAHYRFFFLKTGKMELVPKHRATVKYIGVPRQDRVYVQEMQSDVKIQLIQSEGSGAPTEMVNIEAGCFQMGSDKGAQDEQPVHEVCVSAFKLDKYEVTQKQFQQIMNTNSSRFKGADLPVESTTWIEADIYCTKVGKRLPTEAEWEYAARAGSTTNFYWGDEFDPKKSNYCDQSCSANLRDPNNSDGFAFTAKVGSFPPNALGLHDMAGNVNEWVADWMETNYYRMSPKQDPKGSFRSERVMHGGTNNKIFRGGAWNTSPFDLRPSNRKAMWPDYRIDSLGFRCAADSK